MKIPVFLDFLLYVRYVWRRQLFGVLVPPYAIATPYGKHFCRSARQMLAYVHPPPYACTPPYA